MKSARSVATRLLSGGAWALAGRVVSSGSGLLISILVARLLVPSDAGVYFLALSVASALAVVARGGLEKTVLRLVAEGRSSSDPGRAFESVSRVLVLATVWIGMTAGAAALFGPGVARAVFDSPDLGALSALLAWWVGYLAYEMLLSEAFRGLDAIPLASVFGGALGRLLTVAGLAVLALVGVADIRDVVLVTLVAGSVALLPSALALGRRIAPLRAPSRVGVATTTVLAITLPLFVTNLAFFVGRNADLWILAAYRTEDEVALYAVAARLVLLVGAALSIVDAVLPPLIAEMAGKGDIRRLQTLTRSTASLAGLPAAIVLMLFIVTGRPILEAAFGPFYGAAYPVLAVLSLGQCANVFAGSCGYVLIMMGHQRSLMRAALFGGAISVAGGLMLAGSFGPLGVAAAAAVGVTTQNILLLWIVRQRCGIWTHVGLGPFMTAVRRVRQSIPQY